MKLQRCRGNVLPLVALGLTATMGFAGLGVDVGFFEYRQQSQQSATDAAAIGGAQALLALGCPNATGAKTAATNDASLNGYANAGNITVTVKNPPASGPYAGNNCAVAVTVGSQGGSAWFSRLFGFASGASESTQAVGVASANNMGCIYLLSTSTASNMSTSKISAPGCQIEMNDTANMSNATVNAAAIGYAGSSPDITGSTFPGATPAPILGTTDPCQEIPGCAYLTNNPPSTTGCGAGGSYSNTTLNHGCYGSMSLSGNVTLNSGLYVINGQFHLNNATVTANGVTIYLSAKAQDTNFSSANLTITPPASGDTANVAIYRVPSQSAAVDFSTCTCNFSGLIYFPTSQVNYSTSGGSYQVVVFGSANFSTSSTLDLGSPSAGQTLVSQAILGE